MRQVEIDFKQMINAIDVICRFCTATNSVRCLSCGANLTIKENWDKLTPEEKLKCECPWNGIQSNKDYRTFEFGEE